MSVTPPVATFIHNADFTNALYIIAFALFIYGLSGLTGPKTAVRGNRIAAIGMSIAVVGTLLLPAYLRPGTWGITGIDWVIIIVAVAIGAPIGWLSAKQVKKTAMPQLVALFNGVGGGTVAIIAWVEFRDLSYVAGGFSLSIPSLFAAIIGSVSFWGSNVAFAKLQELIDGKPRGVRGQQYVNLALLVIAVAIAVDLAVQTHNFTQPSEWLFIALLLVTGLLGVFLVLPIGGADMPVVISLLNAFTGLSAAAMGVALNNDALIVAGMIVGASGTILTNQMAVAMNRTIPAIVAGGFGGGGAAASGPASDLGEMRATSASDAAIQMAYANQVVIVPGYGLAVAQAQHTVKELANELEKRGVEVKYAIHPVAGRMPGHMNVLLAEADVPYDQLKEMDEINGDFPRTDVSLVIGANDVTNPAAGTDPSSPIYGMPILHVNESKSTIVLKRGRGSGYAGIENPLFFDPKTSMLFGDAKASVAEVVKELQEL
jgi:NAD(P) transhydrogenase subunit beta